MQGVKRATTWGYSLYEMEVYGSLASPVTINSPGTQNSVAGSQVSLQINATDSSASPLPLTYSISGQPPGLSINQSTGLVSGSPTTQGTSPNVQITASNAHGSATTTFSWTIGQAAPPPAILLSSQKTATASSVEANTLVASNAFDGSPSTRWASGYTNTEWLQVDLGATHTISRVRLVWEAAYGRQYQIQVSNDGTTWTSIFTQSAGTGGTEDLTGLSGTGRYVRMQGVQRGTAWGYSLYQMEVYGN
ncbi:MAG: discoidin domain-containing protein [Methylococcaceae bacterium]|nr:discoidin domain-containing protein [Methylococcaceae bacterium]